MVLYMMYRNSKLIEKDIEVGKIKEPSCDQIIDEPIKIQQPKNTQNDNVFAIQIPNLNILNDDQLIKNIAPNNHTPQIPVAG